ncbi:hypothetical protein J19TS2_50550 [Cohnella xylanilytica]|uniref:hypothetical protein n=1 Tax=Cohnella xylanilytica TaxID=557555 RepID=UPI001B2C63E7|nr:hypothetical protein [Cohnella xylanilytica]GIO15500.1 hypothetical protein J19TS2_50550 [Cohnella xylanilytica]
MIRLPEVDIRSKSGIAVVLAIMLASLGLSVLLFRTDWNGGGPDPEANMPRRYVYGTETASNGMLLSYLRTRPSNVTLEAVHNNVTLSPFYGINGGFFYEDALVSLAVVNDRPVNGGPGAYGAGGENVKYARGTLVWDGSLDRLSVQVVRRASELRVTDRARFWAQGGISMSLGEDERWAAQAAAENAPFPDDNRLRSAAVYDKEGNVYLVVSRNKGSLAAFREAIVEKIGPGTLADGIFLDGDGSSQLRSREAKLRGDSRPVVQMLRIME